MSGFIYVLDFGDFRKIGKTENFEGRKKALESKYEKKALNQWCSYELEKHDDAEAIAHASLDKFLISNERFHSCFDESVKACMGAASRSNEQVFAGEIAGIEVWIESHSGYINATKFVGSHHFNMALGQFLKNESVKYLNDQINKSGVTSYFSTRGRNASTFVHPYIFIEMNRSMTAKHKVDVYNWILYIMPHIEPVRRSIKMISEG